MAHFCTIEVVGKRKALSQGVNYSGRKALTTQLEQ